MYCKDTSSYDNTEGPEKLVPEERGFGCEEFVKAFNNKEHPCHKSEPIYCQISKM